MSQDWRGHAVLQLPVRALESFVRERTAHHDAGFLGRSEVPGEDFVHAHITLLGPFDEMPESNRVARALAPFHPAADAERPTVQLARIETFPNGIIHAVPEPDEPLRAMTAALCDEFVGVLPYRGEFGVRPHVTLEARATGPDGERVDEQWVREWTRRVLPAFVAIEEVDLVWYESRNTRLVSRWRL